MQVTAHDDITVLQRFAKRERNSQVRIRLQGIVLAFQGRSSSEIGAVLGVEARTVRVWVKRYNAGGCSALQPQPGRGRPALLQASDEDRFRSRLEAGALKEDGVCALRGEDFRRILREEYGAHYSLNGVYRLLHRLGYSSLTPRPRHHKADIEAQEAFKKTAGAGTSNPRGNRKTSSGLVRG